MPPVRYQNAEGDLEITFHSQSYDIQGETPVKEFNTRVRAVLVVHWIILPLEVVHTGGSTNIEFGGSCRNVNRFRPCFFFYDVNVSDIC